MTPSVPKPKRKTKEKKKRKYYPFHKKAKRKSSYVPVIPKSKGKNKKDKKELYDKFRNEILKRDNYTCNICKTYFQESRDMDIHHIRGKVGKLLLDHRNVLAVCRACHIIIQPRYDLRDSIQKMVDAKYR